MELLQCLTTWSNLETASMVGTVSQWEIGTAFFIYELNGFYTGIGLIGGHYYS